MTFMVSQFVQPLLVFGCGHWLAILPAQFAKLPACLQVLTVLTPLDVITDITADSQEA